jgi:hypothetical protein
MILTAYIVTIKEGYSIWYIMKDAQGKSAEVKIEKIPNGFDLSYVKKK